MSWTDERIQTLRAMKRAGRANAEIAARLDVTVAAVKAGVARYGLYSPDEAHKGSASWTDERIDRLLKLWDAGHTARQIAAELGGCSRNAVIAKIHRLGAQRRQTGGRRDTRPPRVTTPRKPRTERKAPPRVPKMTPAEVQFAAEIVDVGRVTLLDLEPHHCRWPVGDPRSPDFRFCGADKMPLEGVSYCKDHFVRSSRTYQEQVESVATEKQTEFEHA